MKESFITYTPQEKSAAKECGATWDSTRFSQEAGKSKRKAQARAFIGVPLGNTKQDMVNGLGLASLSH